MVYDQHIEAMRFTKSFFKADNAKNIEILVKKAEKWGEERCKVMNATMKG